MKIIYPQKIIHAHGKITGENLLLNKKTLQIGLAERDVAVLSGKSCLILDFGKEISGGVRILTYLATSGKVRLRFGESVGETCAEIGEKNATNDHSLRDFCVELQNYSDMTFGNTGFRFLRLDVLDESSKITLKSVVAASDADERAEVGYFECDDELVNKIWNTAAYTLRLCIQNGYIWDGVKRDRLVWIGDLYPEMRAARCLFGATSEVENSLAFAEAQAPLPEWINGMTMYSMWWIYNLCDYYKLTQNEKFVCERLDYVSGLVDMFDEYVDENGKTSFGYNFVDWTAHYAEGDELEKKYDELIGVNYLLRISMQKAAWLLNLFGKNNEKCLKILQKLQKADCFVNKYKQIAALGVFAGDVSENNKSVLLKNGAFSFSTFMSYFILTAIANYGEYDRAFGLMKEYYGAMLDLGATTFWENFDLDTAKNASRIDKMPCSEKSDIHGDFGRECYLGFRHSLCHGWSAGVIAYLAETVAGIFDEGDGVIRINPHLSGLKRVKIGYPVGGGVLKLELTAKSGGGTDVNILLAPENVKLIINE